MGRYLKLVVAMLLLSPDVFARDSINDYDLKEALESEVAKDKLGEQIKFYFGEQTHGKIVREFGEFRSNKKTNAFNKSDQHACEWAFLSAMISLKNRAVKLGGNAVVNIKSNYRNNLTSSEVNFQCGNGAVIAGVALVGTVVTIEKVHYLDFQ